MQKRRGGVEYFYFLCCITMTAARNLFNRIIKRTRARQLAEQKLHSSNSAKYQKNIEQGTTNIK